ncbi:hypothetical protein PF003_g7235 [Phytophthora fragariae]|nr:hypothetical protein PF003_g7235 [Phytophthora fragariae]
MPPAVRNWRGHLSKRDRQDWSRLSKLFKCEYCKSKWSAAERYYTTTQRKGEKALAFLYCLNLAAERAGVYSRKSSKKREQHLRQFVRNLSDESLKETLQSHRFKKVADLEYILKQREELRQEDSPPARVQQTRDFRAGNVVRDRFKPKRRDRAFVAQADAELDSDDHEISEEAPEPRIGVSGSSFAQDECDGGGPNPRADAVLTKEELIHEVFRVMERVGCPQRDSSPNPGAAAPRQSGSSPHPGYPPRVNPDRNEYCDDCGRWGHHTEKCWSSVICDRCHRRGHPARMCETWPCKKCEQFHEGRCEDWKAFQEIKKLVRQGALSDLPSHVRDAILDGATPNGEADSEGQQLNH